VDYDSHNCQFLSRLRLGAAPPHICLLLRVFQTLASPTPTCALLGGSNTTVTRRFPQAGPISLDSSRESGKFGPLVATSVSALIDDKGYADALSERLRQARPAPKIYLQTTAGSQQHFSLAKRLLRAQPEPGVRALRK
jgi:hypothetical protein